MGEGRTEAALAAAEVLATRFGCGGVVFALPTMATADAMVDRFMRWLPLAAQSAQPFFLAHSKSPLNPTLAAMKRMSPAIGDRDGCGADVAVALEWLTGRKKGMLANFVVGTMDQVLFAGLRSRHLVLRHLALVGKVVVIDEVHAADVHMSVFLHDVLRWLGAYGVPIVPLSATLSPARRRGIAGRVRQGEAWATNSDEYRSIDSTAAAGGARVMSAGHLCEPDLLRRGTPKVGGKESLSDCFPPATAAGPPTGYRGHRRRSRADRIYPDRPRRRH